MTQYLRKLVPGRVPNGLHEKLMEGAKITGRGVEALRDHLVYGAKPKDACAKHDCHRGLFTRWLQKLNRQNQLALEICQFYSPADLPPPHNDGEEVMGQALRSPSDIVTGTSAVP